MNPEKTLYKTAELVRDELGCYYFICLQCGKDFENLEDTVMHIEKYFYEPSDDNSTDTQMVNNDDSDWMVNDGDVETVLTTIKKEPLEEYEDYKLSIPHDHQEDGEASTNGPIYCPLCLKTLSYTEGSLESHLMTVHHRTKNHAKIYECKVCGRNTFTRSYDLERHQLTHTRYVDPTVKVSNPVASNSFKRKRNGEKNRNSVQLNVLSQSDKPIVKRVENTKLHSNVSPPSASNIKIIPANKRYISINNSSVGSLPQKTNTMEGITSTKVASGSIRDAHTVYCSICKATCSKNETLESHLIRVHRRNKQYARVYECNICGKNSFTRPYDLRRHQLIHLNMSRKDRKATADDKHLKMKQNTDDKTSIVQVPLANQLTTKPETLQETKSVTEVKNVAAEIQTTVPDKDGILCAICNKKFDSYFDVTMHLKFSHNQKRIYKCSHPNCEADSFSNAFFLHRHEMTHSIHYRSAVGNNQNRMKCVFCRRSFNKKWNLMKHEKRHLVEMSKQ